MKNILILIAALCLSSCYTAKRATQQVIKAQTYYPVVVAENCGLWYPPKEFSSTHTEYIRGKDSIIRDTAYVDCTEPGNIDNKAVPVKCDQTVRVDTFIKEVSKQVENTAKVAALNLQNTDLQAERNQLWGSNKSLRKQVYIYQIISIILTIFIIIKFIK